MREFHAKGVKFTQENANQKSKKVLSGCNIRYCVNGIVTAK